MADGLLHEIDRVFFDAAARWPHAVAIDAGASTLTYAALESLVRRLSGWLRARAPSGRVAVLSGDPARAIPAMLAAMDAGWTYAPLDPAWPAARLAAVGAALRPDAVLGDAAAGEDAALLGSVPRLALDGCAALPDAGAARATNPGPSNVFFTSGTTGRPKGILGRPGAVAQYVAWEARLLGAGPGLRVSALAPTSFDASLRDACLPLSVGGAVCVPPDRGVFADGARLAAWLAAARVEVIHTVPTVYRGLLACAPALPALRAVLLAGEALRPSDVARSFAVFGDRVALYNLYGPTETTMTRLVHRVSAADASAPTVPLGRPMDDTEVFVVDSSGRPRGAGRPGEIVLRTPWASLGYLDRPEETARAYVPDLLGDGSPVPVYRTGDLGVLRADGVLEFRGRQDLQVKIRGVRVEIEEIEATLCAMPDVESAAVALRDGPDGEPLLAAWVVGEASVADLRGRLMRTLPMAAVPSRLLLVGALPRLINGKVDRPALRLPDAVSSAGVRPSGPLEERIAAVLGEVMGFAVGATDDLFALGASSLQALQALWRLNEALGVELPVDLLYHARTVAALADRVAVMRGAPTSAAATPGGRPAPRGAPPPAFEAVELAAGIEPPVFWLPPAYGLALVYRALAERLPGRAAVGLELTRPLETADGQGATVEELATSALQVMRARQPQGPYSLAGWSFGGVLAFEIARQAGADEVARLVLIDSAAPGEEFDFEAGDAETAAQAARRLGHMFGRPLSLDPVALRGRSPQALCEVLLDMAAANGLPVTAEVRRRLLTVVQVREASTAAWRRYAPTPWPGAAHILRARDAEADWTAGWARLITGPVERATVAGGHFDMFDEPHVRTLLAGLADALTPAARGEVHPRSVGIRSRVVTPAARGENPSLSPGADRFGPPISGPSS